MLTGRARRRRALTLALAAVTVVAAAAAAVGIHSALAERSVLAPARWPVLRPAGDALLAGARDVDLPLRGGARARGWVLPSRNGAAIVFVHGSGADRRQLLPEARVLAAAGYGALLFDLPGNGESDGERWRGLEQDAALAAIGALASQPETDPRRIGAFGFSIGAAVVASVSSDARWRAFVLAGCFTDVERHKRDDYAKWGPLSQRPALWVDREYASGFASLRPVDQVAGIAPRPLLLVAGDADTVVPAAQARALYAAAGEPKELWVVHGARHGDYSAVAPEEYAARLVRFFDRALE